jgi:regulatory protein
MNLPKKEKFITEKEAVIKIYAFCSYQERNQKEVREKLKGYGLKNDTIEEIIAKLIEDKFLNEERFAKLYAGGKFRVKNWGRKKIKEGLKQKDISSYLINLALKEFTEEEYRLTLKTLIDKRALKEKETNEFKRAHKIAQFVIGKGYEPELVWELLESKIKR